MKKIIITVAILLAGIGVLAQDEYISADAKLEYNQGVDYYKIGQYDRSMASFRRAIELEPNYIDAYYNLGSILEYLKQDEAALAIFKQILVRKPDDYEAVYRAALLSNKLGYIDNAKKYLAIIPADSNVFKNSQTLANSMGTDMQTIKSDAAKKMVTEPSNTNATNAIYNDIPSPTGIAGDNEGNVYVACFSDNMIYKVTPDGRRMIFVKDTRINGPIGMANDIKGNIYIANYNGDNVIKITPNGAISTILSNIPKPYGLYIVNGILYISSQGSNSVLKYKL